MKKYEKCIAILEKRIKENDEMLRFCMMERGKFEKGSEEYEHEDSHVKRYVSRNRALKDALEEIKKELELD